MAVSYVDVLAAKRREVLREIEALREQINVLAARVSAKENQLRNLDDLISMEATVPSGDGNSAASQSVPASSHFLDAAFEALAAAGHPLHYRVVAQRVVEAGAYVPGKDPAANLLTQMTRDPRFARAGGRGVYGLTEWPSVMAARPGSAARRSPVRNRKATTAHAAAKRSSRGTPRG